MTTPTVPNELLPEESAPNKTIFWSQLNINEGQILYAAGMTLGNTNLSEIVDLSLKITQVGAIYPQELVFIS